MAEGRLARALPGLGWLRGYRGEWLRGDVVAGVTVAAYLVPQVMAYAELAGLPAVTGLWSITVPILVYALLGSSRQLSIGPESTTALLTAVALAPLAAGDPGRYAALAATLAVAVGAICLLARLVRLGFLADLFSRPVLVGYMAGVAVVMIVGQLGQVTGVPVSGADQISEVRSFVAGMAQVHLPTSALAAGLLVFFFVVRWLWPALPGPLLGVVGAALVVAATDLPVDLVGDVARGLPTPLLPALDGPDVAALALPALGIASVGYTDNVLTGRAFAVRRGEQTDANQEWTALGVANVAAGLFQGFPVSSSGSRTALGATAGSRTQLFSLVALGCVLAVLAFAAPLLATFPRAALGALVVYAACQLVDVGEIRRIARFRSSELLLTLTTTVAVLTLGVLYGVLAAVALSVTDLLRRIARPHDGVLGYVPDVAGMHDIDDYEDARQIPGLLVYRYDAPLCFANAEDFRRRALVAVDHAEGKLYWFVLNSEANVEVDVTAVDAVEQLRGELDRRGVTFALARVKQEVRDQLARAGLLEKVGEEHVYTTLPTAVTAYLGWYTARHGTLPPGVRPPQPFHDPLVDP